MRIRSEPGSLCGCLCCVGAKHRRRLTPASRAPAGTPTGAGVGAGSGAGSGAGADAGANADTQSYPGARADGSGLPALHHVGMVVRDCERSLARLASAMGFGPPFRFEGVFPDAVMPGGERGIALKGAFVWMGNTAMEIIEPLDDKSPHALFLRERGEGLHHLAYWVRSVRDEIERMRAGGADPQVAIDGIGPGNDVPWCYLDGDMAGSALVELIERNAGSEEFYAQVFGAIGGTLPA